MSTRAKTRVIISVWLFFFRPRLIPPRGHFINWLILISLTGTWLFKLISLAALQSHQFLMSFDFLSLIASGLVSGKILLSWRTRSIKKRRYIFYMRTRSKQNGCTPSVGTRFKHMYISIWEENDPLRVLSWALLMASNEKWILMWIGWLRLLDYTICFDIN